MTPPLSASLGENGVGNQTNTRLKRSLTNLLYAFAAQGISLLLSVLMSLLVPKMLGEVTEFGYWQLFLFYSGYVGFFHFGLNDGIYLRFGGQEYHDLDHAALGTQLWLSVIVQTIIAGVIALVGIVLSHDQGRTVVFITTAVSLVIINASNYLGIIFQMSNITKWYSISVMIDKAFFIVFVAAMLLLRTRHFEPFVYGYLASKFIGLLYCVVKGKAVVFSKLTSLRLGLYELTDNISVGIHLMLSNIASMLIVGTGRLLIDRLWGLSTFGKVSFALSLASFFLLFISQIGMVLFPALRQVDDQRLKRIYQAGRVGIGVMLAAVFLAYLPMQWLLGIWLPQYRESLHYLALLLPLCTFDGKMQMLYNTYLKVLRKERVLLLINVLTFILSGILCVLGGYVIHSVYAIIIAMVVSVGFRSVIAEIYLTREMQLPMGSAVKNLICECSLSLVFVLCTWLLGSMWGFLVYGTVYAVYLLFIRKDITDLMQLVRASRKSA